MTFSDRVAALALSIRDKINGMVPRLIPAGGSSGQSLRKSSGADYATTWANPGYPAQSGTTTAPQASTVVTLANITNLTATLAVNATYRVVGRVIFQSAALTLGANIGFNGPAGSVGLLQIFVPTSAAVLTACPSNRFAASSGAVASTSAAAINTSMVATVDGIVTTGGTSGAFALQFAAGALGLGAVTVQPGSYLLVEKIA